MHKKSMHDDALLNDVSSGFDMTTVLILQEMRTRTMELEEVMYAYPRFAPLTIFCTIGCASIGRSKFRLSSVAVGNPVWENDMLVA